MTETGSSAAPNPDESPTNVPPPDGGVEAVTGEVVDGVPLGHSRATQRIISAEAFAGPLPPPEALARYDEVVPGLAREIVDQWKAETAHRHETITAIHETDRKAMEEYYRAERRGQTFALATFIGILCVAALSIALNVAAVGVAGIIAGGGGTIWAMRRRSDTPQDQAPPTDLARGDDIETPK